MKPYWGKPAVRDFRGASGNGATAPARRARRRKRRTQPSRHLRATAPRVLSTNPHARFERGSCSHPAGRAGRLQVGSTNAAGNASPRPFGDPVLNRADVQTDGLGAEERPSDLSRRLIVAHDICGLHVRGDIGPDDVEPVESSVGGDLHRPPRSSLLHVVRRAQRGGDLRVHPKSITDDTKSGLPSQRRRDRALPAAQSVRGRLGSRRLKV